MPILRADAPCLESSTADGISAAKSPIIMRHGDRRTEHRPEQEGQLHLAHAEPPRVGENAEEQHTGSDERPEEPREARIDRGMRDESDGGRGHNDAVGDYPVLSVDDREDDEHRAEAGGERGPGGGAERQRSTRRPAPAVTTSTAG